MRERKTDTPEFLEALGTLETTLAKAQALVAMSYGEAGAVFRNMSDELQDNFLMGLADLVDQARDASRVIIEAPSA